MTIDQFCHLHPRLYHMATSDSLEQINTHGLLSTNAIVELLSLPEGEKSRLRSERRPDMTVLVHPKFGKFSLRDQKPMRDAALEKCLDGMTVREWYASLNSRVFMWASKERVESLLAARAYRKSDQLLFTIDSRSLIEKYYESVTVSTINSGATLYVPVRRGLQTFVKLSDFPSARGTKPIVEVTVAIGIPDFKKIIISAEIRNAQKP